MSRGEGQPIDRVSYYHPVADPRLAYLKQFQCDRLSATYADFIAEPANRAACHFFFNRLYSTDDTHDRDEAFRKIYATARRFLGGEVIDSMARLIELQETTIACDRKLLEVLVSRGGPPEFDMAGYEAAYRECGNYAQRVHQIDLLEYTMRLVHGISHRLGIGLVLKGLRAASMIVGDTRMVDFLSEGYQAFVGMADVGPLARAMRDRELHRLDRIFGNLAPGWDPGRSEGYAAATGRERAALPARR